MSDTVKRQTSKLLVSASLTAFLCAQSAVPGCLADELVSGPGLTTGGQSGGSSGRMVTKKQPRVYSLSLTHDSFDNPDQKWHAKSESKLSSQLGFPIFSWTPEKQDPKAVIVAIHGATLHARSFDTIANRLSENGYLVLAGDLRGFGSWQTLADPQKNDNLPRHILYKYSQADLLNLLEKLRVDYAGKPIILMGESVGANMAISLLALNPDCADGAILAGTAVKQRFVFNGTVVKQFFSLFVHPGGQKSVEPYIRERISGDARIVAERLNDPLSRNSMNVGEMFKTLWFNKDSLKLAPCVPDDVQILVLEGTEDKFFHSSDIENLMAGLKTDQKTLHWLSGRGHLNLETEFVPEEVFNTVNNWLDGFPARAQAKLTTATLKEPPPGKSSLR